MSARIASLWSAATVAVLALVLPAEAAAESFPSEAGDFVSDNIQYFLAGLVAAILLLLLVVRVTQRRGKEKEKKAAAGPPAEQGAPQAQTAEMPVAPPAGSVPPPTDQGLNPKEKR
ncbi:MAG TPA: hypothetical protein VNL97_02795, partial [Solirubrobacterales bacterium]|nr:hypothetical protein [Solirubrobacterales bacterium]